MATESVFKLTASVQQYDWGKIGSESKVAQFAAAAIPGFVIDEGAPYGEVRSASPYNLDAIL
jgi:mannose-6-phosphate isomerase